MQSLVRADRAVLEMERNGVYVDVDFCHRTAAKAAEDEAEAWSLLRPWVASAGMDPADVLGTPLLMREDPEDDSRSGESGPKLKAMLHDVMGLPPSPFWKKGLVKDGEVKTDAAAVEYLAGQHPEHRGPLRLLLALRRARGSLKYLRKLPLFVVPHTGRVHPVFGPASDSDERVGALTGRKAVKRPELQQIPRDQRKDKYGIRHAFTAPPGMELVGCDYTALEVVILAHCIAAALDDWGLVEAVRPGAPDIHAVHALAVFRDVLGHDYLAGVEPGAVKKHDDARVQLARELIKAVFYGLGYGKGAWGFGSTLFMSDGSPLGEERAQTMIDGLFQFRPGIPRFQDWVGDFVWENHGIAAVGGRWCDLDHLVSTAKRGKGRSSWEFKRAHRRADNFPCQAGGAAIIDEAMAACIEDERLQRIGAEMVLQNHDELLFYCPLGAGAETLSYVHENMVNAWPALLAPLAAAGKYGASWGAIK